MRLRKAPERAGKTATEENNKHETPKKKTKLENNMCQLTVNLFIINECCLYIQWEYMRIHPMVVWILHARWQHWVQKKV